MAKQYRWKTDVEIISGGYPDEEHGVLSGDTDWRTTDVMSGSNTVEYFYRDSTSMQNANSSRVVVATTESWTATINSRNQLIVTVNTTVNSIRRDDIRGNPGTATFSILLRREAGGPILWEKRNDNINTAHTLLDSPIVLDTYTFTIEPGEGLMRGTLYLLNANYGHEDDPLPNPYNDAFWMGTNFQNILPRDYRPGCVFSNGVWLSHNRNGGTCHVLSNNSWREMRTVGGPTAMGDVPAVYQNGKFYNMNQIGAE